MEDPAGTETVTPAMQSEMRSSQRKTMKRGRKAKGKKGTLQRKGSKRKLLKTAKSKPGSKPTAGGGKPKKRAATDQASQSKRACLDKGATKPIAKAKAQTSKTRKTRKASESAEAAGDLPPKAAKVHQERVGEGRHWRYWVGEGQVYGCKNCRWIWGGCRSCRSPNFRGMNAEQMRAIQAQETAVSAPMPKASCKKRTKRADKTKDD